jgi:hypothetical protein
LRCIERSTGRRRRDASAVPRQLHAGRRDIVEVWAHGERIEAAIDWKATSDAWGTPVPVEAAPVATSGGLSGEIGQRPTP